jgi:ERCC4-type nuclease
MLIVDTMEVTNNDVIELVLKNLGIPYKVESLRFGGEEIGDYTNEEHSFLIERKKEDFWNIPHTLSQLEKMKSIEGKKYLFIQGTRDELEGYLLNQPRENAARMLNWGWSVLADASLKYGVEVCFFRDLDEMFKHMFWLDKQSGKEYKPFIVKPKGENKQLRLMNGVEGLGPDTIKNLLDTFGSPMNVFLAENSELRKVKGMGPVRIKSLRDALGEASDPVAGSE